MKLKPINENIILKQLETVEKTKGGIIIPEVAQEKAQFSIVVAINENTRKIKVGDKVLCNKYSGSELITENKETLLIINEKDILAIIKE